MIFMPDFRGINPIAVEKAPDSVAHLTWGVGVSHHILLQSAAGSIIGVALDGDK